MYFFASKVDSHLGRTWTQPTFIGFLQGVSLVLSQLTAAMLPRTLLNNG
jgi:hypothetical protein